jgi:non-canonical (house-cleaning) NTP pyrophosphatase
MLEVPEYVAKKLYEEKMDLGPLMSELSGITNIASQNGSL